MSDSLLFVHSRSNELQIFDTDAIPHTDELSPLIQLAVEVINAGYTGVAIDELELKNGRFVQSLEVDLATPEGMVIQKLSTTLEEGRMLPLAPIVLEAIRCIYERCEQHEQLQQAKPEENSK